MQATRHVSQEAIGEREDDWELTIFQARSTLDPELGVHAEAEEDIDHDQEDGTKNVVNVSDLIAGCEIWHDAWRRRCCGHILVVV